MCDTYCLTCKKHTKSTNVRKEISKNGRMMEKSICSLCKKGKSKFIKSQKGGALYRKKGPSLTDKIAYTSSMFINPTASFGALGRVLASQAYKGVKDNYDYYKSGSGSPWFVDFKKGFKLLTDPGLWAPVNKMPVGDAKKLVQYYKDEYKKAKQRGYSKSYNTFIKEMHWGKGLDIHNAILKVAPKKGFVLPGHRYTGPGNPLEKQVRWDDNGNILHIYEQPTGKTDAVSMQHDVDYSICSNKPKADQVKCKNDADRKMVKALDAIPWKDRQWGHAIARNTIATKAKLGLGVKKKKTKPGKKN